MPYLWNVHQNRIWHVYNIPTMHFELEFPEILSKNLAMLSLTECVWESWNNALCDTHWHTLLLVWTTVEEYVSSIYYFKSLRYLISIWLLSPHHSHKSSTLYVGEDNFDLTKSNTLLMIEIWNNDFCGHFSNTGPWLLAIRGIIIMIHLTIPMDLN